MGDNDPTEEVVKREVAEAARILREDGHAIRLSAIEAKLNKHFPDELDPDPKKDDPNAPPKPPDPKDPPNPPGGKKRGVWWGEQIDE